MRCLYCGKQLALLKRLTGGGEFCSDAHKQSYQDEYNRLALSRLLQAQSKPTEKKAPGPGASRELTGGHQLPGGGPGRRVLPAASPEPELVEVAKEASPEVVPTPAPVVEMPDAAVA